MSLGATDRWRCLYKWLTYIQVAAAFCLTVVSVSSRYEIPAGDDRLWFRIVGFIQDWTIWIIVVANAGLWVAHVLKKYYGNPWAWDTVKVLLEEFRTDIFNGMADLSANHDRVTLFKKKPRRWRLGFWPSSDWLCSVERTGHMTRRRRKWFRVQDDGQSYNGVAGATWCLGRTTLKHELPSTDTDLGIKEYAKETFVTVKYVKNQLIKCGLPKSLCGIMVEVNNKPWGVIVIDSAMGKLPNQEKIEAFYQKNAKVLGKLLAVL